MLVNVCVISMFNNVFSLSVEDLSASFCKENLVFLCIFHIILGFYYNCIQKTEKAGVVYE